eukprot:CAMPEP_0174730410 /NCGR_PEP_ID=MMETSP1094-20130205/55546_1 /TAXON_ID=156173 /ORGANISM="Chrysochromulina brevifilum, Strain UTEX LB 985" /LENGTH=300 /DNA_ID=CAMNT_0015932671 /DNA_START=95 /DNA_END=997 /DNA_ORIENTATION=+
MHFYPNGSAKINDAKHISMLNSQNATWTAGHNARFEGLTYDDIRPLLGTSLSHIADHMNEVLPDEHYSAIATSDIPASFDATKQWSGLVHPIRDQQRCGSCWAFSAAEVLGDRVAIAKGKASPVLSPEDLVSCDTGDMGCSGGQLPNAWSYLKNTGIVTDKCFPYSAGTGTAPTCPKKCADSESWSAKQKASSAYAVTGVTNIQKELMTNGPVQVAFKVYKSFMSYKTGVYKKHWYEVIPEGGHAVKLVGWGTEDGNDYWLVANSWNTNWGLDGFFKISRGDDQCGIEKMGPPYAGMPAV